MQFLMQHSGQKILPDLKRIQVSKLSQQNETLRRIYVLAAVPRLRRDRQYLLGRALPRQGLPGHDLLRDCLQQLLRVRS